MKNIYYTLETITEANCYGQSHITRKCQRCDSKQMTPFQSMYSKPMAHRQNFHLYSYWEKNTFKAKVITIWCRNYVVFVALYPESTYSGVYYIAGASIPWVSAYVVFSVRNLPKFSSQSTPTFTRTRSS